MDIERYVLSASLKKVYEYIDENAERFVEDLRKLCRQPSVSARHEGIEECVDLLKSMMEDVGIDANVFKVKEGHPVVLGAQRFTAARKTLGFYNHYDVQPPEPLELWESPPFSAEIRSGRIYARGVDDNKGNIVARLKAVEAVKDVLGEVPANVKFFFEGEEEVGSPHLGSFVKAHRGDLKADGFLWEGDGVDEADRPVVTLGVKGLLYVELSATGASADVHSSQAPLVPNPAWRLVWALSTLKDRDERIKIADWHDDLMPPTEEEMKLLSAMPFDEEGWKKRLGLKDFLLTRAGVDAPRHLYYSPTCNVCGFEAGYAGEGVKTVLPSKARVKIDFRLPYALNPEKLFPKLKNHLQRHGFGDIEVVNLGGYEPCKTPVSDPFAEQVVRRLREVYDKEPVVWPTAAGTSPMYTIKNWLGIPVVSGGGVGNPDANVHAPNENIRVADYIKSIKFVANMIATFR